MVEANPAVNAQTVVVCSRCHDEIHHYFTIKELGLRFNNMESLKNELGKRKLWMPPKMWMRWPD